ncbi:MAG: zinc-binding dehydrogenase [Rhodospirillaceae bacterium]|nr:zinc-binding dehydrogenase [Rhodospirillaceae bacterium]
MRAAVCRSFGACLEIADIDLRPPGPGEVEVAIAACAVCHSDLHAMDGAWGGHLPAVYGHEAAGHVTAAGAGVAGIATGDPVLVTPIRACGTCPSCAGGHPATCETPHDRVQGSPLRDRDGTPVEQGISAAAFAERVVVDRSQVQKIPADIGMDAACLLSCGVITGFGAVANTAGVKPGSDVAVVGAGGVGLNCIQGAAIAGAARVIAVDPVPEKLDAAREFGATDAVLATDNDVELQIKRLTGGRGADTVLVTVGAAGAYRTAPRFLAPRGQLIAVGMPPADARAEWFPADFSYYGQGIRGSCLGDTVLSRDIPYLVELYRQGRLKLDELVTGRYPLERINDAIGDTRAGRSRRNVILFGGNGR